MYRVFYKISMQNLKLYAIFFLYITFASVYLQPTPIRSTFFQSDSANTCLKIPRYVENLKLTLKVIIIDKIF